MTLREDDGPKRRSRAQEPRTRNPEPGTPNPSVRGTTRHPVPNLADAPATAMPPRPISLPDAFGAVAEPWRPRVVAELNGQEVKVARLDGAFVWHAHPDADELFWVVRGRLRIEFRDGAVRLGPGEVLVVPRGVEHRPVAEEEVEVVLFEPAGVVNTGDAPPSALTAR